MSKSNICSITRCSTCNGFNLQYRYIKLHLDENSLQDTLQILYEYDKQDYVSRDQNPLSLRYGFATLTIIDEDFEQFKTTVEEAALSCIDISAISRMS